METKKFIDGIETKIMICRKNRISLEYWRKL